ncbi:hypothetical protein AVEN_82946-1 [Araneus ventricosus]|uniref:Uncharacterized protein n=1 Tax=Araneus ventricosus TaxID=182803 RepID=A0A4Y2CWF5_ARAVE|nr:hypothetical protein AVEN_82946-1 [Araneus ventricosus]
MSIAFNPRSNSLTTTCRAELPRMTHRGKSGFHNCTVLFVLLSSPCHPPFIQREVFPRVISIWTENQQSSAALIYPCWLLQRCVCVCCITPVFFTDVARRAMTHPQNREVFTRGNNAFRYRYCLDASGKSQSSAVRVFGVCPWMAAEKIRRYQIRKDTVC